MLDGHAATAPNLVLRQVCDHIADYVAQLLDDTFLSWECMPLPMVKKVSRVWFTCVVKCQ